MNIPDSRSLATTRPGLQPEPKRLNLWLSLRKHWWLSLAILLVVGGGGGFYAFQHDTRRFLSTAEIHVARNFQRTLQNDRELELRNTQEYDIFRNEQIGLLLRPEVLEDALRRCGQLDSGDWAPPEAGPSAAVNAFSRALDVYLLPRTYRIAVDLTGYQPHILQPALNSLLDAFLAAHEREFSFGQDKRPKVLRDALAELDATIEQKRSRLQELAEQLNVLNFQENRANPWLAPLEDARMALVEAEREEKNLRQRLDAEQQIDNNTTHLELVLLGSAEGISQGLVQLLDPLVKQRTEYMSRLMDMAAGHPGRADLEQKIQGIEAQISDILKRQASASRSAREEDLLQAQSLVEQLHQEVDDLEGKAKEFVRAFQEGMVLENSLESDMDRRAKIKSRLDFFEMEAQSPSYVRIALPASVVDPQGASNLLRNLGLVAVITILLALCVPLLLELRDERIHTTQDVEAVLGFAPAIWIPERKKESQRLLAADQIRRFALALDRDQSYGRARLVLFTEVKPSRGVDEMLEDIAQALAGFGRRVLVVDAMAPARPRPASSYATPGFLGLLAGKGLQVLSRNGWDYLEYGNPLLEKGHSLSGWNGILRAAAQDYDMVLIKAGPILVSPDAEHMASSADLVVLVVEAETQTRGEVHRAGDVLAAIQPSAVGTILNNAKVFRGHGYYRELVRERKALPPSS